MALSIFYVLIFLVSVIVLSPAQEISSSCALLGPDVPAPVKPSKSKAVAAAAELSLEVIKQGLLNSTIFGPLDANGTSFSLQVYSLHASEPIFSFDYSAPALTNATAGVGNVDQDTIYRIGSVSKLLTVYVYLIAAGDESWNDPITKYVAELADYAGDSDSISMVDWKQVTVGSLASHLGGVARDPPNPGLETLLAEVGFPPLPPSNASYCGTGVSSLPCNRAAFLETLLSRHPTVTPFRTPTYSNAAYTLLAYALENITNSSLSDLFTSTIIEPLNLTGTSYSLPSSDSNSIIPGSPTDTFYSANQYERSPSAAYYSTANDLTKIGRSILNSTLLTPAQTNHWLKPTSFTSNPNASVGAPWEIFRAPSTSPNPYSPVYMYTKNGMLGSYSSQIALLPTLDIGFTVLAASNPTSAPLGAGTVRVLSDILATVFVPALEAAAKEEAEAIYVGTYADSSGAINSSVVISVDPALPGLGLDSWIYNGTDGFSIVGSLFGLPPSTKLIARLYPTGLESSVIEDGEVVGTKEAWRAVFDVAPAPGGGGGVVTGPFSDKCSAWAAVDTFTYGGIGVDQFVFARGRNGVVGAVVPSVFGGSLARA